MITLFNFEIEESETQKERTPLQEKSQQLRQRLAKTLRRISQEENLYKRGNNMAFAILAELSDSQNNEEDTRSILLHYARTLPKTERISFKEGAENALGFSLGIVRPITAEGWYV